MWTPLGDIPYELGTLAMCLGSQHFHKIKQTYGNMDVDRDHVATGWFSNDPIELVDKFGGQWAITEFRAGDVLIFGMFMMHASFNNMTNRFRISSDTRYQLRSEPVDERWIGQKLCLGTRPDENCGGSQKRVGSMTGCGLSVKVLWRMRPHLKTGAFCKVMPS
jgi:hypothetical protein